VLPSITWRLEQEVASLLRGVLVRAPEQVAERVGEAVQCGTVIAGRLDLYESL
jgi:hypothetical protein